MEYPTDAYPQLTSQGHSAGNAVVARLYNGRITHKTKELDVNDELRQFIETYFVNDFDELQE